MERFQQTTRGMDGAHEAHVTEDCKIARLEFQGHQLVAVDTQSYVDGHFVVDLLRVPLVL